MNTKQILFSHIEEQLDAALLQKRLRDNRVQASDRPTGSYVLVNVPSQKDRHKTNHQTRPLVNSRNQERNIR